MTEAPVLEEPTEIPENAIMVHPPHGWVALEKCNANDLDVVNAAKVSFRKRATSMGEAEVGLLRYLMKNQHTTPFEHASFTFVVRAPIFITREWFRHRTWSYNEQSTRYMVMEPHFYLPADAEHMRSQVGKPGHYTFEPLDRGKAAAAYKIMKKSYEDSYAAYILLTEGDIGLAKEVARNVFPLGLYSQFWGTVNPLNFMRFLALRGTPSMALRELRDYANAVETVFAEKMPVTHQAFLDCGRFGRQELR